MLFFPIHIYIYYVKIKFLFSNFFCFLFKNVSDKQSHYNLYLVFLPSLQMLLGFIETELVDRQIHVDL